MKSLLAFLCLLLAVPLASAGRLPIPYAVPGYWGPWKVEVRGLVIETLWLDRAGGFVEGTTYQTGRWTFRGRELLLVWDNGSETERFALSDLDHAFVEGVRNGVFFFGKAYR